MNVLRILALREAIAAKVISLFGGRDPMSLPRILLAAVVLIGCAWNSAMAQQKTAVEVGVLACSFSQSGPVETGRAGVEVQVRDLLCVFKLRSGAEETYTGKLLGVSLAAEYKGTLLWLVKAPSAATHPAPGLLQQSYASDAKAPAEQIPALIGDANSDIVLQSMGDGNKGNVGAPEKSPTGDFVILAVELKLKSTAG